MDFATVLQALSAMAAGGAGKDNSDSLQKLREMAHPVNQTQPSQFAGLSADKAAGMAAATRPVGYEYTPKAIGAGAPQGQRYGVMAQDLERTPVGKQFVSTDPGSGFKKVDTAGLTMANTAAIGQLVRGQQEQQAAQRQSLDQMRAQKATSDYGRNMSSIDQSLIRLRAMGGMR